MSAGDRYSVPALSPISIAIDHLKIGKHSNELKVSGIDLDSGRRVSLELTTDGDATPYLPALPSGLLVLVISIERATLA